MKRIVATVLFATAALLTSNVRAEESASALTLDSSVGILSDYMFRGQNLYSGTSLQPSAKLNYKMEDLGALSGSIWMHVPGENASEHQDNYWETDYTLSYAAPLEGVALAAGVVWYRYPHNPGHAIAQTHEAFISAALDTDLSPTLTIYKDLDVFDTVYYELGFSQAVKPACLGENTSLKPSVVFGFASNADKVYANDGLETATVGLSLDTEAGAIVISPSVNYTFKIDDNTVNTFWSGVTLSYSM